jgi:hypothetical protein
LTSKTWFTSATQWCSSWLFKIGRLAGSSREIEARYAAVNVWVDGLIESVTNYTDIDEARPPDASPRNGDRRCRRRAHAACGFTRDG